MPQGSNQSQMTNHVSDPFFGHLKTLLDGLKNASNSSNEDGSLPRPQKPSTLPLDSQPNPVPQMLISNDSILKGNSALPQPDTSQSNDVIITNFEPPRQENFSQFLNHPENFLEIEQQSNLYQDPANSTNHLVHNQFPPLTPSPSTLPLNTSPVKIPNTACISTSSTPSFKNNNDNKSNSHTSNINENTKNKNMAISSTPINNNNIMRCPPPLRSKPFQQPSQSLALNPIPNPAFVAMPVNIQFGLKSDSISLVQQPPPHPYPLRHQKCLQQQPLPHPKSFVRLQCPPQQSTPSMPPTQSQPGVILPNSMALFVVPNSTQINNTSMSPLTVPYNISGPTSLATISSQPIVNQFTLPPPPLPLNQDNKTNAELSQFKTTQNVNPKLSFLLNNQNQSALIHKQHVGDNMVNIQPQSLKVNHQPQSLKVNHQPQSINVNNQPQSLNVINQPQSMSVNHQPQSLNVNHQPQILKVNEQPQSLKVNHQPQSLEINQQLQSLKVNHQPQSLMVNHQPQSTNAFNQPQSLKVSHQPQPINSVNQPQSLKVNHQPQSTNATNQPQSLKVSHQPQPINAINQPQSLKINHQPHSLNVNNQPQSLSVNHQPQSLKVNNQPQSLKVNHQPQLRNATNQPQSLKVNHQPQSLKVNNQPQSLKVNHQPQSLKVNNQPQLLKVNHQPQSLKVNNQPQSLSATAAKSAPFLTKVLHGPINLQNPLEQEADKLNKVIRVFTEIFGKKSGNEIGEQCSQQSNYKNCKGIIGDNSSTSSFPSSDKDLETCPNTNGSSNCATVPSNTPPTNDEQLTPVVKMEITEIAQDDDDNDCLITAVDFSKRIFVLQRDINGTTISLLDEENENDVEAMHNDTVVNVESVLDDESFLDVDNDSDMQTVSSSVGDDNVPPADLVQYVTRETMSKKSVPVNNVDKGHKNSINLTNNFGHLENEKLLESTAGDKTQCVESCDKIQSTNIHHFMNRSGSMLRSINKSEHKGFQIGTPHSLGSMSNSLNNSNCKESQVNTPNSLASMFNSTNESKSMKCQAGTPQIRQDTPSMTRKPISPLISSESITSSKNVDCDKTNSIIEEINPTSKKDKLCLEQSSSISNTEDISSQVSKKYYVSMQQHNIGVCTSSNDQTSNKNIVSTNDKSCQQKNILPNTKSKCVDELNEKKAIPETLEIDGKSKSGLKRPREAGLKMGVKRLKTNEGESIPFRSGQENGDGPSSNEQHVDESCVNKISSDEKKIDEINVTEVHDQDKGKMSQIGIDNERKESRNVTSKDDKRDNFRDNSDNSGKEIDMMPSSRSKSSGESDDDCESDEDTDDDDDSDNMSNISRSSVSESSDDDNVEYVCKLCSKSYSKRCHLKNHMKSHYKGVQKKVEKKVMCKGCRRKLSDKTALQAHLLQKRYCFFDCTRAYWKEKERSLKTCRMCGKGQARLKDLKKHSYRDLTCRLRFIDLVLENTKENSNSTECNSSEKSKDEKKRSIKEIRQRTIIDANRANGRESVSNRERGTQLSITAEKQNQRDSPISNNCDSCKQVFETRLLLRVHLNKIEKCKNFYLDQKNNDCPIKLTYCPHCSIFMKSQSELLSHKCSGRSNNAMCNICLKFFHDEKSVAKHKSRSPCGLISGQDIQSVASRKSHISGNNTNGCSIIEDSSKSEIVSGKIGRSVTEDSSISEPLHCAVCGKTFKLIQELLDHSHSHTDEGQYDCKACSMIFKRYNGLVSHMIWHERKLHLEGGQEHKEATSSIKETLPSTSTNSLPSSSKSQLSSSPDDSKTLTCPYCPVRFKLRRKYSIHVKSHESGTNQNIDRNLIEDTKEKDVRFDKSKGNASIVKSDLDHRCILCLTVIKKKNLNLHLKQHRDSIVNKINRDIDQQSLGYPTYAVCDFCGRTFPTSQSLLDHVMVHEPSDIMRPEDGSQFLPTPLPSDQSHASPLQAPDHDSNKSVHALVRVLKNSLTSTPSGLKRRITDKSYSFSCKICSKTFSTIMTFKNHLKYDHKHSKTEGWSDYVNYLLHTDKDYDANVKRGRESTTPESDIKPIERRTPSATGLSSSSKPDGAMCEICQKLFHKKYLPTHMEIVHGLPKSMFILKPKPRKYLKLGNIKKEIMSSKSYGNSSSKGSKSSLPRIEVDMGGQNIVVANESNQVQTILVDGVQEEESSIECSICDMSFSSRGLRWKHMFSHTKFCNVGLVRVEDIMKEIPSWVLNGPRPGESNNYIDCEIVRTMGRSREERETEITTQNGEEEKDTHDKEDRY